MHSWRSTRGVAQAGASITMRSYGGLSQNSLVHPPGSFDRVLFVDVDVTLCVQLNVVVEPLGEVRSGAILARYQNLHLSSDEGTRSKQIPLSFQTCNFFFCIEGESISGRRA